IPILPPVPDNKYTSAGTRPTRPATPNTPARRSGKSGKPPSSNLAVLVSPLQNRSHHLQVVIRIRPVFSAHPNNRPPLRIVPNRNRRTQIIRRLRLGQLLPLPTFAAIPRFPFENLIPLSPQWLTRNRIDIRRNVNRRNIHRIDANQSRVIVFARIKPRPGPRNLEIVPALPVPPRLTIPQSRSPILVAVRQPAIFRIFHAVNRDRRPFRVQMNIVRPRDPLVASCKNLRRQTRRDRSFRHRMHRRSIRPEKFPLPVKRVVNAVIEISRMSLRENK